MEVIHVKALVIYATRYGNTRKIAEAIGDGLKTALEVDVLDIEHVVAAQVVAADLLVIGGPTEAHGVTPPVKDFMRRIGGAFEGKTVATFDTRLAHARILTGSAASGIAAALRRSGAWMIEPAESFMVKGKEPELEAGQLARALAWGRELAMRMPTATPELVEAR
jgi:flavodoxin